MAKLRKTLGDVNAPSAVALRDLIDTQSKDTIRKWCLDYAEQKILLIFERIALGTLSTPPVAFVQVRCMAESPSFWS